MWCNSNGNFKPQTMFNHLFKFDMVVSLKIKNVAQFNPSLLLNNFQLHKYEEGWSPSYFTFLWRTFAPRKPSALRCSSGNF